MLTFNRTSLELKPLYNGRLKMKTMIILLCVIIFSNLIIGCGQDSEDIADVVPDFVNGTWEIRSVNNIPFSDIFNSSFETPEFEQEFSMTENLVVFYDTGEFTIDLGFRVTKKYAGDLPPSMTQRISSIATGRFYNTSTTLTIILEPEVTWREEIKGITLEQLELDLATETKEGLDLRLFKNDTEYTWRLKGDVLTLSSQDQIVILDRLLYISTHIVVDY